MGKFTKIPDEYDLRITIYFQEDVSQEVRQDVYYRARNALWDVVRPFAKIDVGPLVEEKWDGTV